MPKVVRKVWNGEGSPKIASGSSSGSREPARKNPKKRAARAIAAVQQKKKRRSPQRKAPLKTATAHAKKLAGYALDEDTRDCVKTMALFVKGNPTYVVNKAMALGAIQSPRVKRKGEWVRDLPVTPSSRGRYVSRQRKRATENRRGPSKSGRGRFVPDKGLYVSDLNPGKDMIMRMFGSSLAKRTRAKDLVANARAQQKKKTAAFKATLRKGLLDELAVGAQVLQNALAAERQQVQAAVAAAVDAATVAASAHSAAADAAAVVKETASTPRERKAAAAKQTAEEKAAAKELARQKKLAREYARLAN